MSGSMHDGFRILRENAMREAQERKRAPAAAFAAAPRRSAAEDFAKNSAEVFEENLALREENAWLKGEAAAGAPESPLFVRLAPLEARIFNLLMRRERLRRAALYDILYAVRPDADQPSFKGIDVVMAHLRRKLRPHGVAIITEWGSGWRMDAAMKARARGLEEAAREPFNQGENR